MVGHRMWGSGLIGLAIAAAVSFAFAGCDDGDTDGGADADGDADSDADGDGDADGDVDVERCGDDGDCDDGRFCNGAETCDPEASGADDDGCVRGEPPCDERDACDDEADECIPVCDGELDGDGDGHDRVECGGDDCDDDDTNTFPGNVEVCDTEGHDEDCNPGTFGFLDADGDGSPSSGCCNADNCGSDCNDNDATINFAAIERCDGVDNDCDGSVDRGCACEDGETRVCGETDTGECSLGTQRCVSGVWAECVGAVLPRVETCNGYDDDCEGAVENGFTCQVGDSTTCTSACGTPGTTLCLADCSGFGICRAAEEVCNDCDDDGDGAIDEDFTCRYGASRACDVCGEAGGGDQECLGDCSGWTACHRAEVCNGCDDDADGVVDDGVLTTYYLDADHDTYGGTTTTQACSRPEGYSAVGGDCDDMRIFIHPAALEVCDGWDTDCGDGGGSAAEDADGDGFYTDDPTICVGGLDCADSDAAVSPAHTAFSTRPHCAGAFYCTRSGSCCPTSDLCDHPDATCFAGSYDWNCDYIDEPPPAEEVTCSDDSCPTRYQPAESSSALCGHEVTWVRCYDWGGTVGCLRFADERVLPCR